ncbi:hypothetical protein ACFWNH_31015 [Rhodococcus qingshengii]|uniref:hypothetical protein n=1 Tax=Rhodococcus qingshengii TaxID=334542 RepID=UPI0036571F94
MAVSALFAPAAAGANALLGAGAASPTTPVGGDGYVGGRFDQNETLFIADTNLGNAIDVIPNEFWGVYLANDFGQSSPHHIRQY